MRWVPLVAALFVSLAFAGCLGDDEPAPDPAAQAEDDAPQAKTTGSTGGIEGRVVSRDLVQLDGATVVAELAGSAAGSTLTDDSGDFAIGELAPGQYIVLINAVGYKHASKVVNVEAGKVSEVNVMLPRLSDTDLQSPYIDRGEFAGFIACGVGQAVGQGGAAWSTCSSAEETPIEDPNDRFLFELEVGRGVEAIAVGMTWEPVGGVSGRALAINMEREGCSTLCEDNETYAHRRGPPDLVFQVGQAELDERGDAFDPKYGFAAVEDTMTIQFRVFPAMTEATNIVYQQPFTIYYEVYYYQQAPDGRNPVPDL